MKTDRVKFYTNEGDMNTKNHISHVKHLKEIFIMLASHSRCFIKDQKENRKKIIQFVSKQHTINLL